MEAMVAFMAVMVVLAAYLGVTASLTATAEDPTVGLDPSEFTGTVSDGVFVPSYGDYMGTFLDVSGCRGISVSARIPGGFAEVPEPMTVGVMDGALYARTLVSEVSDGSGRTVPAFFEVTVCA